MLINANSRVPGGAGRAVTRTSAGCPTILVNGVGGGVGLAVARLAIGRELPVIGTGSATTVEHGHASGKVVVKVA